MFVCCGKKKKDRKHLSLGNLHQLNLICQDGLYFDKNLKIITENNKTNASEIVSKECKYYCPICFKYYDCMLQSTCCSNYVCHICAVQSLTNKMYNCHYCRNEQCKYVDVDPNQQLKIYTDSHYKL
ncbi:unnamed protein product [Paramecium sonneborni]|uniref:Uncharacterized protein n=1 Tax=Paramecium sonneborni TaxID=65129 RepID=A0A8S1NYT9_9CILI|nr:unnamed protein product [Paramecium sonneborni]